MKSLRITQFGNSILRQESRLLSKQDIASPITHELIRAMRHTLTSKKLGVGLAAPQVGQSLALAVICIRPTPHRPHAEPFDLVIINPVIISHPKRRKPMWEGCISSGVGSTGLFAKVPRYMNVTLRYLDELGLAHENSFTGLVAHVIQHEVDHLNGVLFVDRVKDTTSFTTMSEYKKLVRKLKAKHPS